MSLCTKAYNASPEYWTKSFLTLNGKNFNLWDAKLHAYLRPQDCLWALEEPAEEEKDKHAVIRNYVLTLIQLNLDDAHLMLASKATSPDRLYTLLRGQARPTNKISRHGAKLAYLGLRHEAFPNVVAFSKHLENEAVEINKLSPPDEPVITDDDRLLTLRASTRVQYERVWGRFDDLRRRPYLGQSN